MGIHFANPKALILLALLVFVVIWARKSMAGLGPVRGTIALVLRFLIVLLTVLALAQLQWSFTKDEMAVVVVFDQSRSVPDATQKSALDYLMTAQEQRESSDSMGMVVFGRNAALERRPARRSVFDPPQRGEDAGTITIQSMVPRDRTNISSALQLALAAMPPSSRKRIVMISDGNQNLGSAMAEAEVARRNGVRIDVLPVQYEYEQEVMVEKVVAPAQVEKGESFDVRVVVTAEAPHTAILRLEQNRRLLVSQPVELKAGRNVQTLRRTLEEAGHYDFTAIVESPQDTLANNNKASAFTIVHGAGQILYVESDPEHGRALERALAEAELSVRRVGLESLPLTLGQLVPYDTVILSNVPASALGDEGMRALELAVKDWGVGLICIGGPEAYGPGGYQGSPLERALPVDMEIKHRKVMPKGALVVILHTCEIPSGNYWARQVALAALRVLSSNDEYGLAYFDWQKGDAWLFPLQEVGSKTMMAQMISGCQPGDAPSFIQLLNMAHTALKASDASVKHTVIISDGDPQYPSDDAVKAMVDDDITISTIGINPHGPGDTQRLQWVARLGGGNYYEPSTATELPQIFIKEAATVRRALISEETFVPQLQLASEVVKGIGPDEFPPLRGYVLTTPASLAEVPLVSHMEDPVLAHWQYGLGRAVAFTSDAKPRWAADWVGWEKYRQFWSQIVRWSARSVEQAGVRAHADLSEDRGRLIIDAVSPEGNFLNDLDFDGVLVTPDQEEVEMDVKQIGPGRYEAEFDAPESGTHYLSLRYTGEDGRSRLYTHGMVVPYSAEFSELSTNAALLEALAETTGGRMLTPENNLFARTFEPAPRYADAWPYLLLLAVLLMPADVFTRRVFIDAAAVTRRMRAAAVRFDAFIRRKPAKPAHTTTLLEAKRLSREQMKTRARKFESKEPAPPRKEPVETPGEEPQPEVKVAERPEAEPKRPAVARDDETTMGRLLRAKRQARDKDKEKSDDPSDRS